MILYTMVPHELIFPYNAENYRKQQMITYQGIPLLVELTDQQDVHVIRILSTDPQHYMDDKIYPGAKISLMNLDGLSAL
ncbi:YlzJ-like family protein [Bacillus sp. BRMEA1]|uniref:YlzJ-like family protein n=1 Tax=Neobacillus endophyticus TaxID=2738405 RepID=UPI00156590F5|nr:YlzJ-like family protein [Neobacillus endophyticus]NRD78897.1 YlzJ-like family protein [Neobacillus endophyticus]